MKGRKRKKRERSVFELDLDPTFKDCNTCYCIVNNAK